MHFKGTIVLFKVNMKDSWLGWQHQLVLVKSHFITLKTKKRKYVFSHYLFRKLRRRSLEFFLQDVSFLPLRDP